jgi:hypothetical protein
MASGPCVEDWTETALMMPVQSQLGRFELQGTLPAVAMEI